MPRIQDELRAPLRIRCGRPNDRRRQQEQPAAAVLGRVDGLNDVPLGPTGKVLLKRQLRDTDGDVFRRGPESRTERALAADIVRPIVAPTGHRPVDRPEGSRK